MAMVGRVDPDTQAKLNTPTSVPSHQWNMVRQITSKVCFAGGMSKREYMVQTIEVKQADEVEPQVFVNVSLRDEWFLKMIGGGKIDKSQTKHVRIIDRLEKLMDGDQEDPPPAVAEANDDNGDSDPMEALEGLRDPAPTPKKAKKNNPARSRGNMIHRLVVKSKPACAADCGLPQGHSITVHVMRGKRQSINVRADHIPWLVAYAVDELNNQGIGQVHDDTDLEANVPGVNDCYIEWDFGAHEWQSRFLAGPHEGVTRAVGPHHRALQTASGKLQKSGLAPDCDASTWSYYMRRKIAYGVLKAWNSAIASGDEDSFACQFDLGHTNVPDAGATVTTAVAASSAMVQPEVAAPSAMVQPS